MSTFHDLGPAFRATGKGYHNRLPKLQANAHNANARLHNRGLGDSNKQHELWLFCTGVETGWNLAGEHGQSIHSRVFYPKALSQDEIAIEGIVANQYEYDRIVEFVQKHHETALKGVDTGVTSSPNGKQGGLPVDFRLAPYRIPTGRDKRGMTTYRTIHGGMHYEGYITSIEAGHRRFINAPTFVFKMQVTNDFLHQRIVMTALINAELQKRYLQHFGSRIKDAKFGPEVQNEQDYRETLTDVDPESYWSSISIDTNGNASANASVGVNVTYEDGTYTATADI